MTATTDRAALAARIRALLSKTTAAGCTEAEALAAASLASRLMAQYDLTYADLGIERTVRGESYGARKRAWTAHPVRDCLAAIADLFDTMCWRLGPDLVFFGQAEDTERAHGLTTIIQLAMDHEWSRFWVAPDRDKRMCFGSSHRSFMLGMAIRVGERIDQLKAERSRASVTGRELVVIRAEIVNEKFDAYARQTGIRLRQEAKTKIDIRSARAYDAGRAAGDRANIGGRECLA